MCYNDEDLEDRNMLEEGEEDYEHSSKDDEDEDEYFPIWDDTFNN